MEIFSALLVLCTGNSPVSSEFPSQRSVTRSFYIFFDTSLNKRLSKQSRRRWFETPSHSLWRHCNGLHNTQISCSNMARVRGYRDCNPSTGHHKRHGQKLSFIYPSSQARYRRMWNVINVMQDVPCSEKIHYNIWRIKYAVIVTGTLSVLLAVGVGNPQKTSDFTMETPSNIAFMVSLSTHWGRDKMDAISQTTFSNAFSWMKMSEYRLKFHWSLFLRVQLTISQYWFR